MTIPSFYQLQACHACTAVNVLFHSDANTQNYLKDLDNMHKIVLEVCIKKNFITSFIVSSYFILHQIHHFFIDQKRKFIE